MNMETEKLDVEQKGKQEKVALSKMRLGLPSSALFGVSHVLERWRMSAHVSVVDISLSLNTSFEWFNAYFML